MKNFLLLSVFITILAYFLPINSFTAPVPPVRTMYVPWAYNITLDGVADEYYSDLQNTEWGYPDQQESYDGESDFKADFRICMNSGCLFLLAEVTDDVEHDFDWSYESSWMFDNIEIFLQLDTNTVTTTYDGHTIQLRICRGLDSVESPGRAARSDFGYYMEAQASGGWITEVAIPWTAVLAEGENPDHINDYMFTSIGFDFSGADSDNAFAVDSIGTRDYQTFWDLDGQDGTEDLAWNNTSVFGYINLMQYVKSTGNETCNPEKIETISPEGQMIIYPNPATDAIYITHQVKKSSVTIFTMLGAAVMVSDLIPGEALDISILQSGIYRAVIDGSDTVTFIKK